MDLGLESKVAWVLGASSGLGLATATALAEEGAAVAISSRDEDRLTSAAEAIDAPRRPLPVPVDVTDSAAIQTAHRRIAEELGAIDILVSNAGGPPPGGFDDFSDDDLYSGFTLTAASAWRLAKQVLPDMQAKGSGCLIFLTSSSTKEVIPGLLLSNMMRAAVVGLAKTLSKELGPQGIRVLCAAPGRIETDRLSSLDERQAQARGISVEEVRASMQATIPLRRYGRPREFGDVVAFLASERASYITGVNVVIDGGMLSGILS
jgi:3-oxoacyl-[acyl-carrier protein] reductase